MVLAMAAGTTQATVIFNVSDSQTMFDSGGFESGTDGTVPVAGDPTTGTYITVIPGTTTEYRNAVSGVTPNEGNLSLFLDRNPDGPILDMALGAGTSDPGDVVEIRTAFFLDSGIPSMRLFTGGFSIITQLDFFSNGVIKAFNGTSSPAFATTLNIGQWNDLVIQYTNGDASNLSLSVNGSAFETLGGAINTPGSLENLRVFASSNGTSFYLDSIVPEPASLGLLGVGGLLMLARGNRK